MAKKKRNKTRKNITISVSFESITITRKVLDETGVPISVQYDRAIRKENAP